MKYIIGIDEVGRGPLAGPVVVAAVCTPANLRLNHKKLGRPRDSKQLSALVREAWFAHAVAHSAITYAIAKVSPAVIDTINITKAANRAAFRVFTRLMKHPRLTRAIHSRRLQINDEKIIDQISKKYKVFLDGGLYLESKSVSKALGAKTVVKGDIKIPAISLASIIAKVTRDRLMTRLAKQYPQYGFELHKGYGTALHRKRIKEYSPSSIHRLTFLA